MLIFLKFTCAYFIYDTIYGIVYKYNDNDMHFHHFTGILFVGWPLYLNYYGSILVYSIILGEITSPLMNFAEFLENIEKPKKALAETLKKIFMAVFIYFRIFFCYSSMVRIQLSEADWFFKFIPTFLWVLSMKWVWMMLNKASKIAYEVNFLFSS